MASKNKRLNVAAGIFKQSIDGVIRKISLSDIIPATNQPRQNKEVNIKSLANSLVEEGLLQPIVVTKKNDKYLIVAGERRYRAAKMAKWQEIECRILDKSDRDTYRLAVIENLQREDLEPFEEASAFKKLKLEFTYTDQELASIIGKSRNYITEILSIADIPKNWQDKAIKIGISSKNMLVQYALALRANNANEFLAQYKTGHLTTVKDAKNFNKLNKPKSVKKEKTSSLPTQEKITIRPRIDIKTRADKNGDISMQIHLSEIGGEMPNLAVFSEKLREFLNKLLKNI